MLHDNNRWEAFPAQLYVTSLDSCHGCVILLFFLFNSSFDLFLITPRVASALLLCFEVNFSLRKEKKLLEMDCISILLLDTTCTVYMFIFEAFIVHVVDFV